MPADSESVVIAERDVAWKYKSFIGKKKKKKESYVRIFLFYFTKIKK